MAATKRATTKKKTRISMVAVVDVTVIVLVAYDDDEHLTKTLNTQIPLVVVYVDYYAMKNERKNDCVKNATIYS